uniref:Uncharacterized protein n=1 Tax=Strigamia maritima TaxID=126957 RepID=T1JD74_STRMM
MLQDSLELIFTDDDDDETQMPLCKMSQNSLELIFTDDDETQMPKMSQDSFELIFTDDDDDETQMPKMSQDSLELIFTDDDDDETQMPLCKMSQNSLELIFTNDDETQMQDNAATAKHGYGCIKRKQLVIDSESDVTPCKKFRPVVDTQESDSSQHITLKSSRSKTICWYPEVRFQPAYNFKVIKIRKIQAGCWYSGVRFQPAYNSKVIKIKDKKQNKSRSVVGTQESDFSQHITPKSSRSKKFQSVVGTQESTDDRDNIIVQNQEKIFALLKDNKATKRSLRKKVQALRKCGKEEKKHKKSFPAELSQYTRLAYHSCGEQWNVGRNYKMTSPENYNVTDFIRSHLKGTMPNVDALQVDLAIQRYFTRLKENECWKKALEEYNSTV